MESQRKGRDNQPQQQESLPSPFTRVANETALNLKHVRCTRANAVSLLRLGSHSNTLRCEKLLSGSGVNPAVIDTVNAHL